MTPELFAQWKKKKTDERMANMASQSADRAKNDRMRYQCFLCLSCLIYGLLYFLHIIYSDASLLVIHFFSGRELFMSNASLFVDDIGAWEHYERHEAENNEPEVGPFHVYIICS